MSPPDWAVEAGKRLDLDEFGAHFADLWRCTKDRFLKLECWQTYQEPSARSLAAFSDGNLTATKRFVQEEAEADRSIYEDVRQKSIDFARVRLVRRPFTPYLKFEFINYRIREGMGETIRVLELENVAELPNEEYFDFLLFDRDSALVHDYGEDGLQRGGWHVDQVSVIGKLESIAEALREKSVDLGGFLASNRDV
jgi:hypothetical protein